MLVTVPDLLSSITITIVIAIIATTITTTIIIITTTIITTITAATLQVVRVLLTPLVALAEVRVCAHLVMALVALGKTPVTTLEKTSNRGLIVPLAMATRNALCATEEVNINYREFFVPERRKSIASAQNSTPLPSNKFWRLPD